MTSIPGYRPAKIDRPQFSQGLIAPASWASRPSSHTMSRGELHPKTKSPSIDRVQAESPFPKIEKIKTGKSPHIGLVCAHKSISHIAQSALIVLDLQLAAGDRVEDR